MKLGEQAGGRAINISERVVLPFLFFFLPHSTPRPLFSPNLFANRSKFISFFPAPSAQLSGGAPSCCAWKNNLGGEKWQKRTM